MAFQKTKFTVGLFVVSGIGISVMAVIWLGMSRYFEKGRFYAAYFNESVQGLSKDAPVKYRGVPIGRVEKIRVAPDSNLIEVILSIETGQTLDRTYVAQLKDVGITGSMFVELDRKKPDEPDLSPSIGFPSEYPIVASKPSELSRLLGQFTEVLNHIKTLDLQGISDKIKQTLDSANLVMAEADVKGISGRLKSTLDGATHLLDRKRWDDILSSVNQAARSVDQLIQQAKGTLNQVDKTLTGAQRILAENEKEIEETLSGLVRAVERVNNLLERSTDFVSRADESAIQLKRRLYVSAQNLERATENLIQFMELIADQPSQLVLGEPPAERVVPPGQRSSQP